MKVRPLDSDGDMTPLLTADDFAEDNEAVGTIAKSRLNLIYGEWWEDETIGFQIHPYLLDSAKAGDISYLGSYIAAYLSATEGCTGISDARVSLENRTMTFACTMHTATGAFERTVTEDELLSAIY